MTGPDVAALAAERLAASGLLDMAGEWRRDLAAGVAQLDQAATVADSDAAVAVSSQVAAQTVATTARTRAAAVAASIPVVNLAYVTAIRDELVALHTRDAQIADAMAEVYGWRAALDSGYALVCRSVSWLGRLVQKL